MESGLVFQEITWMWKSEKDPSCRMPIIVVPLESWSIEESSERYPEKKALPVEVFKPIWPIETNHFESKASNMAKLFSSWLWEMGHYNPPQTWLKDWQMLE